MLNIIIYGGIIMKSSKKQKILAVLLAASLIAGTTTALSLTASAGYTTAVTAESGGLVEAIDLKTDGTSYDDTLSSFDDYQYYKVVIEEDGAFNVKFTNSNPNLEAILKSEFYNEDFSIQYGSIEIRNHGTPKTESNTYYLYKGTYYLKISAHKGRSDDKIDEPTAYKINGTFKSANSNVNTPNNSSEKAMEISINTKYNTIRSNEDKNAWYKFTLDKDTNITFVLNASLFSTSPDISLQYDICNSDMVPVYEYGIFNGRPSGTIKRELKAGTYYIHFYNFNINGQSPCFYNLYYYETAKGDPFAHEHSYSKDWKYDDENHWHECSCGDKTDTAKHDLKTVIDKEATVAEEGAKHDECTVCGYKGESKVIPKVDPDHEHSYGDDWYSDETNHWHECTVCGEKADTAEHEFGEWVIDEKTSTKHRECTVCEYPQSEIIPHIHTYGEEWKSDETNHWHECTICGDKSDTAKHDLKDVIDKEATATETGLKHKECTVCGYKGVSEVISKLDPTPTPTPPQPTPTPGKVVNTGDNAVPITIASVIGLGAVTAFVISYKKKRS